MRRRIAAIALAATAAAAPVRADGLLLAGAADTADFGLGRDLVHLVAAPAGIGLDLTPTRGAVADVLRLGEHGARLALVQADVYAAYLDEAARGNRAADRVAAPLRVVMPLGQETIHVVVRADSPLRHLQDLRGRRINIGAIGSGGAYTATALYARLFGEALPAADASFLPDDRALERLATDPTLDAVVVVAGSPSRLFEAMPARRRRRLRLLDFDAAAPGSAAVGGAYAPTTIRAASYPGWLAADVPTLSVRSLLVTRDFRTPAIRDELADFARALCVRYDRLRAGGRPEWRELAITQPVLPAGWQYYAPTHAVLDVCPALRKAQAQADALAAGRPARARTTTPAPETAPTSTRAEHAVAIAGR
ncbi:MAG: TAXI family TRAP transporter solute-binding subunit [Burkholderiaceae bacterium]